MSEIRELQRKLLRDWRYANSTNIDIYNQIVNPMSNRDYDYFMHFLLLLHQNNGIVDNELVNNYILIDTESKEQLRKAEEVKRADSADGKRERQLKEEERQIQEEERRLKEERRIQEEERRKKIQEEERRIHEEERRIQKEEQRIREEEQRIWEEEREQIQNLINTTANVLELPSTMLLTQFVDHSQLDLIVDSHSVDSYGYGYTSYGHIHYPV